MEFINFLNDPFTLSVLRSICTNLIITKGKEIYSSFKGIKQEYNEVLEAIDKTINYIKSIYNKNISRNKFLSLFNLEVFHQEVQIFTDGKDLLSISKISNLFAEHLTEFNLSLNEIEDIVDFFYKELISNFLDNENSAHKLLGSLLQININKTSDLYNKIDILKKRIIYNFANLKRDTENIKEKVSIMAPQIETIYNILIQDDLDRDIQNINVLFEQGLNVKARDKYMELLALTDETNEDRIWRLNNNIGMTYFDTFEEEKAVFYFNNAFNIKPTDFKSKLLKLYSLLIQSPKDAVLYGKTLLSENNYSKEIIQILTHAHLINGTTEECIEYYRYCTFSDSTTNYDFSLVLINLKNFEEAEKYLLKAIEIEERPEFYDALSYCILSKINYITNGNKSIINSEEFIQECHRVKYFSDEAISLLQHNQNNKLMATALFHRGILFYLLSDFNNSMADFNRSEELGFSCEAIYINRTLTYIKLHQFEKAIKDSKKAYFLNQENFGLLASCLYDSLYLDEAENLLLKHLRYPNLEINETNFRHYLMLADILSKKTKIDEAAFIITSIDKILPNNCEISIYKALQLWYQKKFQESISEIENAIINNPKKVQQLEIFLANYLYNLPNPDWEKAFELYDRILVRDNSYYWENNDIAIERAVICLFKLEKYSQLFKLRDSYKPKTRKTELFLENIKGNTYYKLGNIKEANQIYKSIAPSINSPEIYINWALTEFRLGNNKESEKILDLYLEDVKQDFDLTLYIAVTYSKISRVEKAFQLIWELYLKRQNDVRVLQQYFWITHLFTQKFADKVPITKEQVELFRNIPVLLNEYEPSQHFLTKIDVDENFESIQKILQDSENSSKILKDIFKSKNIPLSIMAKLCDKKLFETWYWVINENELSITCMRNIHNERAFHLQYLDKVTNLVIEPISIFLLNELKLIDILKYNFNISVPQYLLDEISDEINNNYTQFINNNESKLSIFTINGQMYYQELSYDEVKKSLRNSEDLRNKIVNNTVGLSIKYDKKIIDNLLKIFHISTLQTFLNSNNNETLIISDEWIVRKSFKMKFKIKSVSTYSLIHYMYLKGLIKSSDYYRSLYKLVGFGYEFIPFNCNTLLFALIDFDFNPQHFYFKALIKSLKNSQTTNYSAKRVIRDFWNLPKIIKLNEEKKHEILKSIIEI